MAENTKIEWTDANVDALSELDCAYLAGLIDGEGSIYVLRHTGRGEKLTFYPAVSIAMTHRGVLDWVAALFGLSVSDVPRSPDGWRDQNSFRIHGKRAVALCRRLLPYLRVKCEQARLVQAFPFESRMGRPRSGRHLSAEIIQHRADLRDQVNALNTRGAQ